MVVVGFGWEVGRGKGYGGGGGWMGGFGEGWEDGELEYHATEGGGLVIVFWDALDLIFR